MQGKQIQLLFVDDEPTIRITLPLILERHGFAVTVAATVKEAIELIHRKQFDVLLSDLNIGCPADGFTVVGVMRRVQPEAATLILTGFPDFESALQAIRNQVDDYLTKPAEISTLVAAILEKVQNRHSSRCIPTRRAPELLQNHINELLERWLARIAKTPDLAEIVMAGSERLCGLSELVHEACQQVLANKEVLTLRGEDISMQHGEQRSAKGYRPEQVIREFRLLQYEISLILQEHLLAIDLSTLITDAMRIAEILSAAMEQSIRAFRVPSNPSRSGAKAS